MKKIGNAKVVCATGVRDAALLWRVGDYGLTILPGELLTVTHMPTGFRITDGHSRDVALRIAKRFAAEVPAFDLRNAEARLPQGKAIIADETRPKPRLVKS